MRTGLIRWTPQTDLVRGRLNRLFDEAFNDFLAPMNEDLADRAWVPPVDIRETEDAIFATAELPGLSKEDIDITLENNVLTLRGERKFEKATEKETHHRVERQYGAFSRSFALSSNVSTDQVEAEFENGLLTLRLPKVEEAKARRIAIR